MLSRALFLQKEQKDTIRNFREAALNLLISTSVAEEGLDIPECNLVVRYGLLTNEIAQKQASGRARATDSHYSVVAQKGGREENRERVNEYLDELTEKAIAQIQEMSLPEFRTKVRGSRPPSSVAPCLLSVFCHRSFSPPSLRPDNEASKGGDDRQRARKKPKRGKKKAQRCCKRQAFVP